MVTQLWELSSAEPGQSPGASKATPRRFKGTKGWNCQP